MREKCIERKGKRSIKTTEENKKQNEAKQQSSTRLRAVASAAGESILVNAHTQRHTINHQPSSSSPLGSLAAAAATQQRPSSLHTRVTV